MRRKFQVRRKSLVVYIVFIYEVDKKFPNSLHPIPCIFVGEQHILASGLSVYSHSHWLVNFFTTDSSLVLTRERWQNFGHFRIFFPEHPVPKSSSSSLTRQEHFGLCNVSVIVQVHGLKGTHQQFFKPPRSFDQENRKQNRKQPAKTACNTAKIAKTAKTKSAARK